MSVILIVDDNEALADFARLSLESAFPDSQVFAVGGYRDARVLADRVGADIVVLDRMLPDGDGLELFEEFGDRFPGVQAVLTSAAWSASQLQRARDNNAVAILEKPYDMSELVNAVRVANENVSPEPMGDHPSVRPPRATGSAAQEGGAERLHQIRNQLSALLAGLRAFGADLRADLPESEDLVQEYEPRLVNIVLDLSSLLESPALREAGVPSTKGGVG